MKSRGVDDVKKSKYFTPWDLIPYAAVIAIAVVLLLAFLLPAKESMTGFYVEYGDKRMMSYDFSSDRFDVSAEFENAVKVTAESGGYTVEVDTSEGHNVFFVDKGKRTVKMTEADCSFSKDCTYMPAIEQAGDSIICVPHKLKIIAEGDGVTSPVTGWVKSQRI